MAINQGTLKFGDPGTGTVDSASISTRRLYNFGDRVADLAPEESPFFVYLSKVAKVPTDDPQFRFLEDRTKIDWTSRSFVMANAPGTVAANTSYTFQVADADTPAASIDWLVKGMVIAVNPVTDATVDYGSIVVRVESAPVAQGSDTYTEFTGKVISLPNSSLSGYNAIADDDKCQVIGTSFGEGTGAPDVWSSELQDDYGYTQIFKTAAEMTNTAVATRYRGYPNEWARIWALKLREHKVDIERTMLFGHRASSGGINYTEGLVGHCVVNVNPTDGGSTWSYSTGKPYYKTVATGEMTYDSLLADLEVLFDPARGGSEDKLVLAGLPVITFFNKLGNGFFIDTSIGSTSNMPYTYEMKHRDGSFGHKLMTIETVHGTLHLVKEPLFRGFSSGLMCFADMGKVAYRPLVGNGVNRDTHIMTNVQSADEDLRKDMILTEAGLEITLPESHALYSVESL